MTGAVVQPEPVGSLKIVANVDVRQTVAVDVTNLHSQSKVRRWRDRTPIFISKSGFPRNGREVCLVIVQVKHIRFAIFVYFSIDDFEPFRMTARDDRQIIDHAKRIRATIAQNGFDPEVIDVQVQVAVAVNVSQRERRRSAS